MELETYASEASNHINLDVLLKARNSCYHARDRFYACLEKHADKKHTQSGTVGLLYPQECHKMRNQYENQCKPTWVKHFDRQYCSKKKTQRFLDDYESRRGPLILPQPCAFKSP